MRTSMSSERARKRTKKSRDVESGGRQVAVRLPTVTIQRADALAERISQPGIDVSRSGALRVAVHRGLDAIEADKKGRKRPMEDSGDAGQTQTAVRLHDDVIERVDALAARISQPGLTVARSEALRLAILCGLDELEAEHA